MMTDFIQSHNHYKMGNTKYYIYYKGVFSQGHILLSTVVGCKKKSLVPASRSKHAVQKILINLSSSLCNKCIRNICMLTEKQIAGYMILRRCLSSLSQSLCLSCACPLTSFHLLCWLPLTLKTL